jgi:hypothetical protein
MLYSDTIQPLWFVGYLTLVLQHLPHGLSSQRLRRGAVTGKPGTGGYYDVVTSPIESRGAVNHSGHAPVYTA